MRYAILFPGQGSQFVGMGADVVAARPDLLGDRADAVLGWSLGAVCAEGPEERLTATDVAQPALFAISYALWEALAAAPVPPPVAAAGHSLGEYTALAAAGSVTFEDGLRLVAARGAAMGRAAAENAGGMAALIGGDVAAAQTVTATRREAGGSLWVANDNAPGQVVVAGSAADVAWLCDEARSLGFRRAIPLKVAGAFHTPLMQPAADELKAALDGTRFAAPAFPVWSNVSARPGGDVAADLASQLVGPVRFRESLEGMAAAGVEAFVHVGPWDVTAGMARRIVPDASVVSVSTLQDIAPAVETLAIQ
jgi:[acyl-carrier-protein] S-malonyltransferase